MHAHGSSILNLLVAYIMEQQVNTIDTIDLIIVKLYFRNTEPILSTRNTESIYLVLRNNKTYIFSLFLKQ